MMMMMMNIEKAVYIYMHGGKIKKCNDTNQKYIPIIQNE